MQYLKSKYKNQLNDFITEFQNNVDINLMITKKQSMCENLNSHESTVNTCKLKNKDYFRYSLNIAVQGLWEVMY